MKEQELEKFPRKYDYFFSDPTKWINSCQPSKITLAEPYNRHQKGSVDILSSYRDDFMSAVRKMDVAYYKIAVEYLWYRLRFGYMARSYYRNDWDRNTNFAYGIFLRHFIGMEKSLYFSGTCALTIVRSYYNDFIDAVFDPRVEEIEFPYENVSLAHMAVVADMDERLQLLEFADRNKMLYNDFCDFVSNWVGSFNEKYGEKYQLQLNKKSRMVEVINLMRPGSVKGTKAYE